MTLTREIILSTPAGLELDALVEEHVLGWRWLASKWGRGWAKFLVPKEEAFDLSRHHPFWVESLHPDAVVLPMERVLTLAQKHSPSTDIAAAWPLMASISGAVILQNQDGTITFYESEQDLAMGWQPMRGPAPETICRAALLSTLQ